jgi:zinc protease
VADRQPVPELPATRPSRASQVHVANSDSLQEWVTLTQSLALQVTSPDRFALELGNAVLGGGFSSRLYQDLRVNSGYVYSVGSGFNWQRTRARFAVSFAAERQNVDKARALILDDIRRLQTTPLGEAELSRGRALMLRRMSMQRASVGGIGGLYLYLSELDLPLDYQQSAARHYAGITAEEVRQAFAKWLRTEDLAQVVEGPSSER